MLAGIAYAIDSDDPANLVLSIVLVVVVLLTGTFSYYQEAKSAAVMAAFQHYRMSANAFCISMDSLRILQSSKNTLT